MHQSKKTTVQITPQYIEHITRLTFIHQLSLIQNAYLVDNINTKEKHQSLVTVKFDTIDISINGSPSIATTLLLGFLMAK